MAYGAKNEALGVNQEYWSIGVLGTGCGFSGSNVLQYSKRMERMVGKGLRSLAYDF